MNHEGDMKVAKDMLYAVAQAGGQIVKFQLYDPYTFLNSSHYLWPKRKEIKDFVESWPELITFSHSLGLRIGFSIFSKEYWIAHKESNFIKIAARQLDDPVFMLKYLKSIRELNDENMKPLFVSYRKDQNLKELKVLFTGHNPIFMGVVSKYPTDIGEAIERLYESAKDNIKSEFWGTSIHCPDPNLIYIASKIGATCVEVHFTLDKKQSQFRDHECSLDYEELEETILELNEGDKGDIIFN